MVFHIESVTHTCSISPNGNREFKTTFELSHGILDIDEKLNSYPEMSQTNMDIFDTYQWLEDLVPMTSNDSFGIPTQKNIDFNEKSSIVVKNDPKKQKPKTKKKGIKR
jgi:hypothetical protein